MQTKTPPIWRGITHPTATFETIAKSDAGFGQFMLLLCIEVLLLFPERITVLAAKLPINPAASLSSLLSLLMHFAIGPIFLISFGAVILHYASRRFAPTTISIWNAGCVLGYTWTPHTLLVSIGTATNLLGWDMGFLPHRHIAPATLAHPDTVTSHAIEIVPSLLLVSWAIKVLFNNNSSIKQTSKRHLTGNKFIPILIALPLAISLFGNATIVRKNWNDLRPLAPGQTVGRFKIHSIDGQTLEHTDLTGRVSLIDIWATWCAPCIASMPHLNTIYGEFQNDDFQLISINADPENRAQIYQIVKDYQLAFPIFLASNTLLEDFRIDTFPTLLLVNRQGRIEDIYMGAVSLLPVRTRIEQLLKQ